MKLIVWHSWILICLVSTKGTVTIQGPAGNVVLAREALTLRCTVAPLLTGVSWNAPNTSGAACLCPKDSSCLVAHPRYSCSSGANGDFMFSLTDVTVADEGTYTCRHATNPSEDDTILISVQVPITRVDVISPTSSLVVTENVASTFVCETSPSRPTATIQWYKKSGNGHAVALPVGIISTPGSGASTFTRSTLQYSPTRTDHGHRVYCTAYNIDQTSIFISVNQPQLIVQYEPSIKPIEDIVTVEGRTAILSCEASSRPASTFTWRRDGVKVDEGVGTSDNNSYAYVIQDVDRDQDGTYTCTANNEVGSTDTENAFLIVNYAPNVSVTRSSNDIQEQLPLQINCSAAGKPSNYIYKGITQTWKGIAIQSYPDTDHVQIPSFSLEHSGTYTCVANNGVPDRAGTVDQSGSIDIRVKVSPKVLAIQNEFHGSYDNAVNVIIPFYSLPLYTSLDIKRQGTSVTKDSRITIDTAASKVTDDFFGINVVLDGYMVTMTISDPNDMDFSNYTTEIRNDVGTVAWPFLITSRSRPDPPKTFRIIGTSYTGPLFVWEAGFNGGYEQTFIIEVAQDGTNNWIETRFVQENAPVHMIQNGLYATGMKGLSHGVYTSRIYSRNEAGRSDYAESVPTFTISPSGYPLEPEQQTSTGAIAGGVVAGIEAIIIVVIVVILIRLRRRNTKETTTTKTTGDTVEKVEMKKQRANTQQYDDIRADIVPSERTGEEKPNVYETLDPELRSGTLYDTPDPRSDQHQATASQEYVNMKV